MRIANSLSRRSLGATLIIGLVLATGSWSAAREEQPTSTKQVCADDNGGITLPAGFCATVFADNIGHARITPMSCRVISCRAPCQAAHPECER